MVAGGDAEAAARREAALLQVRPARGGTPPPPPPPPPPAPTPPLGEGEGGGRCLGG